MMQRRWQKKKIDKKRKEREVSTCQ